MRNNTCIFTRTCYNKFEYYFIIGWYSLLYIIALWRLYVKAVLNPVFNCNFFVRRNKKIKKRILSLLLVVAMLATMIVMPAYAVIGVDAEDYNNTPDKCPCGCGKAWSEITDWIELSGSKTGSTWSTSGKTHYRLSGHVTASSAVSRVFGANTGHGKWCLI